jgi:hypothetical protein
VDGKVDERMNKETLDILNGKNGKDTKKLLDFCALPRTPNEVFNFNVKNVSDILVKLMKSNAIVFKNGKYVATEG